MTRATLLSLSIFSTVFLSTAAWGEAQTTLKAAPSTRATTEVLFSPPRVEGQPAPPVARVKIDYGQPHARGRVVAGALAADLGKVWRLGANDPTALTTEVDLDIGGSRVPKGTYTLYVETTSGAWKLIVSRKTGQAAAEYDPAADVARIALVSRTLTATVESFTMWLIPKTDTATGELRFAWGTLEHSVPWSVH